MNKTNATETAALIMVIDDLKKGLKSQNANIIKEAYKAAQNIDLEITDGRVYEQYEAFLTQCNDYLYKASFEV